MELLGWLVVFRWLGCKLPIVLAAAVTWGQCEVAGWYLCHHDNQTVVMALPGAGDGIIVYIVTCTIRFYFLRKNMK